MTLIIQKPTGAKLVLSKIQQYPAVLGEPWGGGYFAGYISHTADGNPTHALIVAPRATGATGTGYTLTTNLAWKTASTTTSGATSAFDGAANTAAIIAAGIADHPAAEFCVNLNIDGFTDWYLPSFLELDIAYFHLKPGAGENDLRSITSNIYAIPARTPIRSSTYPAQTYVDIFKSAGSQQFQPGVHNSSTDFNAFGAWYVEFASGLQFNNQAKTASRAVRAFRRIAL